jgi:hypothetical protein
MLGVQVRIPRDKDPSTRAFPGGASDGYKKPFRRAGRGDLLTNFVSYSFRSGLSCTHLSSPIEQGWIGCWFLFLSARDERFRQRA